MHAHLVQLTPCSDTSYSTSGVSSQIDTVVRTDVGDNYKCRGQTTNTSRSNHLASIIHTQGVSSDRIT